MFTRARTTRPLVLGAARGEASLQIAAQLGVKVNESNLQNGDFRATAPAEETSAPLESVLTNMAFFFFFFLGGVGREGGGRR